MVNYIWQDFNHAGAVFGRCCVLNWTVLPLKILNWSFLGRQVMRSNTFVWNDGFCLSSAFGVIVDGLKNCLQVSTPVLSFYDHLCQKNWLAICLGYYELCLLSYFSNRSFSVFLRFVVFTLSSKLGLDSKMPSGFSKRFLSNILFLFWILKLGFPSFLGTKSCWRKAYRSPYDFISSVLLC